MPHHAPNPRLFHLMRRKHRRSIADDHEHDPDGPIVMAPAGTVDPTDSTSLDRRWEDPATVMASVADLVDRASAAGTLPASTDPPTQLPTDLPESSIDSPTAPAPTLSVDAPAPTLSASASQSLESTTSLPLSAQTSRPLVSSTVSPVSSSGRPSSLNASTAMPSTSLPTSTPMSTTTTHTSSATSSTSTSSDDISTTTTTAYATETDVTYWGGGGTGTAGTGSAPSSTAPPATDSGPPDSGKIAGGVVGGVAAAAMVVFLLLMLLRRWRKLGLRPTDGGALPGETPRETTQTRRLSREPLFAAATLAPTFLRPWRASRQSTVTAETTLSSTPSERGFQKISGRKIESVLQSGGDGYDGRFGEQQLPHSPTLSEPSMGLGSSPVQPRSPMSSTSLSPSIPPPSMPFGMALDTSYTREADEPEIMVLRPSPARTRGLCPRDGVGRSHPSFDGSKGSRFTESI